ncbi:MAG: hypothetical protein KJO81_09645 [Gammaproteobacteria bacterium]|nr:hypothetical protein [Gammaproteobacteria bacterium]MBT8125074.1 hypothetical protein [Gammaproteobacteria bacterium]NNC66407.1 hypothetical protein [Gammaproteobacteria bacterium]
MIRLKYRYLLFASLMMAWALLFIGSASAEETSEAQPPPEIVIDAPPPTQSPVKQDASSSELETVTIYESKVLPGFRPCTTEDYRNQDTNPIACQDEEAARVISTREKNNSSEDLIVEDDAVPQGNIYKLKFERFKKKKTK